MKHLHLACADHARSVAFFEAYFGFGFERSIPRGDAKATTVIRSPTGFQIALETDPRNEQLPKWFHIGFLVESADQCRALYDRMVAAGVTIVEPFKENGQLLTFLCADPDGHDLQVYWDPAGTRQ
jgi:predicted enzyme related to lactoylglutathione lyase